MIRHHYPGMKRIIIVPTLLDCVSDNRGNIGHPEIHRTASLSIEQPVHTNERSARREGLGEMLSARQTPVQPESNEQRVAHRMEMRQMAASDKHLKDK